MGEMRYDFEMIIDHEEIRIMGAPLTVASHRMVRGYTLKELIEVLKLNNESPNDIKITINIRGVSY